MGVSNIFKQTTSFYKNNFVRMIMGSAFVLIIGYFCFYFAYALSLSLTALFSEMFGIKLIESNNEIIMIILSVCLFVSIFIFFCFPTAISVGFMFGLYENQDGSKFSYKDIFTQLKGRIFKVLGLYFLIVIFTFLWSLLLIVPGIIKGFSYSQAFFVLKNNPDMKLLDCITKSREIMDGKKKDYFLMVLIIHVVVAIIVTIIYLASSLSAGGQDFFSFAIMVIILVVLPYYLIAFTNFFLALNNKKLLN